MRREPSRRDLLRSGPVSLDDFEVLARRRLTDRALAYVAGGAADEITLRRNRSCYDDLTLEPRMLVDVSSLDLGFDLFGRRHPHPILIAPTATHALVHDEAELATARGAASSGATLVVSSLATRPVEEIAGAGNGPLWFQLYLPRDRGFGRALVERVHEAGCEALVLTVDTPVTGIRNREDRVGFRLGGGFALPHLDGARPAAVDPDGIYHGVLDPSLTWKDVEWLASISSVPVVLKGILSPRDVAPALDAGASGIVVSNHGARNLDTAPATIEALPRVVEAADGRVPVLVDGGVRRGTDVVKALARGACAVLLGRPVLYGLGVAGEAGVARVVELLRRELEMAMALCGTPSLSEIDGDALWGP